MTASIWTPGSNNIPAVDPLSQIASQRFTATEGQTAFVISTFTYAINVGALTVYVNRTKIPATEITETSESTFTLLQPCDVGDLVEVIGQTAIDDPGNAVAIAEAAAAAAAASAAQAAASEANANQDAADAAASAALAASLIPVDWRGDWLTATAYEHNDAVFHVDGSYICQIPHTSTTWAADSANWELLAQSGGTVSVNGQTGIVQLNAVNIPFTPTGSLAATEVQGALVEVDSDVSALASTVGGLVTQEPFNVKKTSATGTALLPAGTDAQRDVAPAVGAIRFSSTAVGWEGWNGTNWVPIGGGQMLGQALIKGVFYNAITIAENLTVAAGTNGLSAGPVTVANGFSVTVSDGSTWSVV